MHDSISSVINCLWPLLPDAECNLWLRKLLEKSINSQVLFCLVVKVGVCFVNEGGEFFREVRPFLVCLLATCLEFGLVAGLAALRCKAGLEGCEGLGVGHSGSLQDVL